jgi:hypothetical protein
MTLLGVVENLARYTLPEKDEWKRRIIASWLVG